ncbi:YggS family pyridoxal phosphate-dependent enzyme [Povalibacter sp.]|uniref:YggS family pyridoxal phosphate-dependent enzyme n=2 Tax=Povalibacter sp. TaxID=1962978 RepID=UPI002D1FA32D|nr:YggS family pyridoxal phosphate-dependent enzyme [Povalibacter sp.]
MPEHDLTERFAMTRTRIASATTRAGRPAGSVSLVAISKGQPAAAIRALAELGQRDFGENYLQEAMPKLEALRDLPITWHFTGQIQSNKTRTIAESFAWVHTLDRERIALRLNEQRPEHLPPINVCLEVRLEEEAGKGGAEPAQIADLAARVRDLPRLKLRGLMALPPPRESFAEQKQLFDRVANLLQELQAAGFDVDTLSMGMSGDLEAAIAAGATYVRVGTALFGERRPA